jgi:hypothetical protein
MTAVADTLGVARSHLVERVKRGSNRRSEAAAGRDSQIARPRTPRGNARPTVPLDRKEELVWLSLGRSWRHCWRPRPLATCQPAISFHAHPRLGRRISSRASRPAQRPRRRWSTGKVRHHRASEESGSDTRAPCGRPGGSTKPSPIPSPRQGERCRPASERSASRPARCRRVDRPDGLKPRSWPQRPRG